jgi:hypothetical protein
LPPNRDRIARYAIYLGKITEPSYPRRADTPNQILGTLTPCCLRGRSTGAVELRNEVQLLRCQLRRNRAHLLVDVVLAKPLGKGRELALDIGGLLRLQLRRAELVVPGTVTCGARRNPPRGSPTKTRRMAGFSSRRECPA